jgi:hypothetical protein
MKFSIVLPSRDRVGLLGQMLDSFKENTDDLSQIEILIVHDDDDHDTPGFLDQVPYTFFKKFSTKRSMNFSKDYYNFLASKATGEWIVCGNDDMRCQTLHWDILAYEALKDKPRVIYGYIEDGLGGAKARGGGEYCCFPLQGMEGVRAMGFVFPTRIPVWGADMWARNLYDHINSTVKLPITFFHYSHHNRTRPQDAISHRIAQNQVAYSVRPERQEIEALVNALNGRVPDKIPETPQKNKPRPINYGPSPIPRPIVPQPKPWVKKRMWVGV